MMVDLLVSDLDFTLTKISTLLGFMDYAILEGIISQETADRKNELLEKTKNGKMSYIEGVAAFNALFASSISGLHAEKIAAAVNSFFSPTHFRDFAIKMKKPVRHIIVSATPYIISSKYASELGAELIAPRLEVLDGAFTGRFSYEIFSMDSKSTALRNRGIYSMDVAIGDSMQDLSFLEMAEHPIAVYPKQDLKKIAELKGIPVVYDDNKLLKIIELISRA